MRVAHPDNKLSGPPDSAFVAAVVRRWIGGHHRLTAAAFCSRARERVDRADPPSHDGGYEILPVSGLSSTRGSALLLVLGMIVLLSALILAFLASVSSELTTSQTYANGATVKQLADSATQLVISQVVSATGNTNSTLAWASQPGMIRTYDTSGNPALFYKLYSSSSLITNAASSTFTPANEVPPIDWDSANKTGLYTDLNSPVSHGGTLYFPIIDPRALTSLASTSVEGFTYSKTVDQATLPSDPGGVSAQRLPMPVLWLYVLQNGALATPVSGTGGAVTFDNTDPTKVPSASNPIVGRIAYWTDDETCKVNINTASEGTFWDRPWVNNTTDQNLATAIPAQNEFQRFPGHPAKTSLSTVLGPLGFATPWPNPSWYFGITSTTQQTYTNQLNAYYGLTPRVSGGGTEGGNINEAIGSGTTSTINPAFRSITLDNDRLYTSTDELLYDPTRAITTKNSVTISNTTLEKAKFFLTAHSRAPEVNLFGKPRMALWPLQASTALRNAKDRLIAFCGTIGGQPYYFQRSTAYTAPGVLGTGSPTSSSQSAKLDWTAVPRNQTLYSYINNLMKQNIPGFGGKFSTKYPNTGDQILTEMFDMIRSGVNGYSNGLSPQYNYAPTYLDPGEGQIVPLVPPSGTPGAGTHGFGRFITLSGATIVFYRANSAQFVKSGSNVVTTDNAQKTILNPSGIVMTTGAQIGAVLILNPFTASPGFPPWSPNVTYKVTGLEKFTVMSPSLGSTFKSFGFPVSLSNTTTARAELSGLANCTPFFNVVSAFRFASAAGTDSSKTAGTDNAISKYPFIVTTGCPQLAVTDTTFDFNADPDSTTGLATGHPITVTIYSGSDTAQTTPIQTLTMNFPPIKGLLVPTTVPSATTDPVQTWYQYINRFAEGATSALSKPDRLRMVGYSAIPGNTPTTVASALGNDSGGNPVTYYVEDIARSVEADGMIGPAANPAQGDYRVYAALSTVPASYFTTSPGYDVPNGSIQTYTNAQTLRDQGIDGSGVGAFGCDASVPGGFYEHFVNNAAGVANTRAQVLASSVATGLLIPQTQLAQYGGTDGNGSHTNDREYRGSAHPAVPSRLGLPTSAASASLNVGGTAYPGDWDNLTGLMQDGPFINKPDEGNSSTASNTTNFANLSVYTGGTVDITGGYFSMGWGDYSAEAGTTFSPNRQISSAVMFGSLPTGIDPRGVAAPKPWQTLLFCANPAAGVNHPGFGVPATGSSGPDAKAPYSTPPDHLVLDLFTMPVAEPYAISEPLSTAGKVNMNYQILPFTYITRDTGLRAVLKSSRIMAIPQSVSTVTTAGGSSYKDGLRCKYEMRYNINPDETVGTLKGFENRFAAGDIFHCASEICNISLVPQLLPTLSTGMVYPTGSTPPSTYAGTANWWSNFLLTGDNTRESPYGDIYPRLTTKSNTYTVHVRVQTLKKVTGTNATQWIEGTDLVTGEYRGSSLIERYVDTSDPTLPDFTTTGSSSVEGYYKIRIVNAKRFEP